MEEKKRKGIEAWRVKPPTLRLSEGKKNLRGSGREKKRKRIEVWRVKHPTQSQAIDALRGDEEQNGKEKRIKRKKQGAGPPPSYPGPL